MQCAAPPTLTASWLPGLRWDSETCMHFFEHRLEYITTAPKANQRLHDLSDNTKRHNEPLTLTT
jgi:hypothetical protein